MKVVKKIPKLKPRAADAHKGDFGRACIIAGSVGMSGAAALAGRSALRAGAGLVRVAIPKSILPIVASIEPAFTTISLPEDTAGRISTQATNVIMNAAKDNDVFAIGPGLGTSTALRSIISILIEESSLRVVIDADGLNNLSILKDWHKKVKANVVLTPHPGEMRRLWKGTFDSSPPADRQEQAGKFAEHTKTTVVLKGAGTVVTDGEQVYVNNTGNPGMATAGSGDVLTGVIAALMGQSFSNFDAAVLGVYIHGLAGDIAAEKTGQISLIATDIVDTLDQAFKNL